MKANAVMPVESFSLGTFSINSLLEKSESLDINSKGDIENNPSSNAFYYLPTNTIFGTENSDTIYGNSEWAWTQEDGLILTFTDDIIYGLGGNDTLYGRGGDDSLFGGSGNDNLFGGSGDDLLVGGVDSSSKKGSLSGIDYLTGGDGADTFHWDEWSYVDGGSETVELNSLTSLNVGSDTISGLDDYFVITDFNTAEGDLLDYDGSFSSTFGWFETDSLNLGSSATETVIVKDTSYFSSGGLVEQYDLVGVVVDQWVIA